MGPHSPWAYRENIQHTVERLLPLYLEAAAEAKPTFINLDMEEFKDLEITLDVFQTILDHPKLRNLEAGIVLQAYLPDSLAAMMRLQEWAALRRANGGAAIKVRVVKGANLPMERVESALHDWPLATWSSKQESDTNYKRVIEYSLEPERIQNVRIGVAGHNLFDIAWSWLLANRRGVAKGIEFEMLLGMAPGQAEAVRQEVGSLLLYTPVVHPKEFDVAIAYLIRRLEEGASHENFMSAVFELAKNESLFERERQRFLASLDALSPEVPKSNRVMNRLAQGDSKAVAGFRNAADTDPAIAANREWAYQIVERAKNSRLGSDLVAQTSITSDAELEQIFTTAASAAQSWGALTAAERAEILHRAGSSLEAMRGDLIEVMLSETGKTFDQADPEVSEAIDFAHYYAEAALQLEQVEGACFTPAKLTLVTPPWNFPVAIPAGSTLAALAAGSPVIIKPASQASRSGAAMVQALWNAGIPKDALQLVNLTERSLGAKLIGDPRVERLILTGGYETAELFRSFRHDLPLLAETSGKNAIIVTPSADLDLAAKDVAYSAFGHAGQKCSAASLVILVGEAATSARFRAQLVDAVSSLRVDYATNIEAQMGPIISPADGKLKLALTTLGRGESWLVEPKQLDASGKLWSPGIRDGVKPGSEFHLTEYFGPVLGIMRANSLEEAIELQNQISYGLTSGLQSLDAGEVALWVDSIEAGNLYVNRSTTGAIVQRQPFGGWKKSAVGAGAKAGGPNYLMTLGTWTNTESVIAQAQYSSTATSEDEVGRTINQLLSAAELDSEQTAHLQRAAALDEAAWKSEFGVAKDVSNLGVELNYLRYRTLPIQVRLAEKGQFAELVRVVVAGIRAGSNFAISTASEFPLGFASKLATLGLEVRVESDSSWLQSLSDGRFSRVRSIGLKLTDVAAATGGRPDLAVFDGPVTAAGRIELLPFLREQAVSITAHRFGTLNNFDRLKI
jgi:RHH-type proline utilization regulon transcriptional repressor/proline dehydrogenase/delta 1-pyrroline-5-carboxylate dehydrogenase